MIRLAHAIAVAAAVTCRASGQHVLAGTPSPNKQIAVVEERGEDGDRDYYFLDEPSGKKLGLVLPAGQRHRLSNVAIVAS